MLAGLGLLAIWTIDLAQDPGQFSDFKKQLTFVLISVALTLIVALTDYRALRSLSRPLYIFGALLLVMVLLAGTSIRGTRGWFRFGDLTWQPVELAKMTLILVVAKYLSIKAHVVDWKVLTRLAVLVFLYVALILGQPDFGSALVLLIAACGMLLLSNVPKRYVLGGMAAAILLGILAWGFFLKDYQKDRVRSFLDPTADPFGRGYNIRQSVIAVGAGGLLGQGIGEGSQSQLRFLPEAQTDFIFAVLAEQLGFFIVALMLASYGIIMWRLFLICKSVHDGFALFCVAGFFIIVALQVVLNIGMNMGLLPIVGLPLPFVSLGGSSMLANFLMLGIVESIRVRG